jgi:PPK2 family polyphosphate:nucleotide phosphotransferase
MNLRRKLLVSPGRRFRLDAIDPGDTLKLEGRREVAARVKRNVRRLGELQHLLYAENRRALLVVLQAMDAGGKDGAIRHVMTGLNPQGCRVTTFKVPSAAEASRDFLWRVHQAVPARGEIGVFNRSHYEDVLVVRVHNLVPRAVWSRRYDQINAFERMLAESGTTVVKCFLHISKSEQKKRLRQRLEDPRHLWKVSEADFRERRVWGEYMAAYQDVLRRCSTPWAPWYVIPADHKWFRDFAISRILVETLEDMDLKFPPPTSDPKALRRLLRE